MGRPLKKDVLGTDVIGTPVGNTGIRVEAYYGGTNYGENYASWPYIYKQRGAKTFVIKNTSDSNTGVCVLQAAAPSADGQMRIKGVLGSGNGGTNIPIAKITKRVATDFNGNRYTWFLVNDSSNDYIQLTAITSVS